MKIAICDDNKLFISDMKKRLEHFEGIDEIREYSSYIFLKDEIAEHYSPDLVLMDMDWEAEPQDHDRSFDTKRNGMILAEEFYKYSPLTKILFVTSYVDYFAERMFLHPANIAGFLSKPVDDQLLRIYIQRVQKQLVAEADQYLTLQKGKTRISYQNLVYIESKNHTMVFHLLGEEISKSGKLTDLEHTLPEYFVRVHRGFIVNLNFVESIQRLGVNFKTNTLTNSENKLVPVGRSYYEEARKKLALWASR